MLEEGWFFHFTDFRDHLLITSKANWSYASFDWYLSYRKSHLLSSHEKWIFSSISHINSSLPGVDHTFTHHGESRVPQKLIKPMGGGARDTITCDFSIFLERWTWVVYSDTNRRATWFQSFLREWIQQQTLTYPYNQKLRMDDRSRISPTFFLGKSARTQSCQSFIVFLSNRCLRWKATKPCPSSSAQ